MLLDASSPANGIVVDGSSIQNQMAWFALQVRSQYERGVAERLSGTGYELFLPLYKCRRQWSDRIKEVDAALFPGYLFCRFDPLDRLPILRTPGVIQIVSSNHVPIPLNDVEISAIQTLVAAGVQNQPWPFLAVGDQVQISSGPLSGLVGTLIAFKGKHRLVISITLLQRSVATEIDCAYVTVQSPSKQPRSEKTYLNVPSSVTV
jgi:transcription antitermination factor NusG